MRAEVYTYITAFIALQRGYYTLGTNECDKQINFVVMQGQECKTEKPVG